MHRGSSRIFCSRSIQTRPQIFRFCLSSVISQSAGDGVFKMNPSVLSEKNSYFTTLIVGDIATNNHAVHSAHRSSTGTLCNLAHSAHMVVVVLKFQHPSQLVSPELATAARTCVRFNRRLRRKLHPEHLMLNLEVQE